MLPARYAGKSLFVRDVSAHSAVDVTRYYVAAHRGFGPALVQAWLQARAVS